MSGAPDRKKSSFKALSIDIVEALHFAFDPIFDFLRDYICFLVTCIDGSADAHGDRAWIFQKRLPSPASAGVVRDRHHRHIRMYGNSRTAGLVAPSRARRNPRPFREY